MHGRFCAIRVKKRDAIPPHSRRGPTGILPHPNPLPPGEGNDHCWASHLRQGSTQDKAPANWRSPSPPPLSRGERGLITAGQGYFADSPSPKATENASYEAQGQQCHPDVSGLRPPAAGSATTGGRRPPLRPHPRPSPAGRGEILAEGEGELRRAICPIHQFRRLRGGHAPCPVSARTRRAWCRAYPSFCRLPRPDPW